jgi:hypothetical protein
MEAVRTSETSVDNHFTRQYNPEDSSEHHIRRRENLKSHMIQFVFNMTFRSCYPAQIVRYLFLLFLFYMTLKTRANFSMMNALQSVKQRRIICHSNILLHYFNGTSLQQDFIIRVHYV